MHCHNPLSSAHQLQLSAQLITLVVLQLLVLSKCSPAVEHPAGRHLPAISWQFQDPSQQFQSHFSTRLRPVFIVCTALFLSEVTVHCLLHGFLDTHLLIHSWCNIARNRVGTVIGRGRRWNADVLDSVNSPGHTTKACQQSITHKYFPCNANHWNPSILSYSELKNAFLRKLILTIPARK